MWIGSIVGLVMFGAGCMHSARLAPVDVGAVVEPPRGGFVVHNSPEFKEAVASLKAVRAPDVIIVCEKRKSALIAYAGALKSYDRGDFVYSLEQFEDALENIPDEPENGPAVALCGRWISFVSQRLKKDLD